MRACTEQNFSSAYEEKNCVKSSFSVGEQEEKSAISIW